MIELTGELFGELLGCVGDGADPERIVTDILTILQRDYVITDRCGHEVDHIVQCERPAGHLGRNHISHIPSGAKISWEYLNE